jgi:hypothetical protein
MIRITVELVSAISPKRNRVLGIAEIANVGGDLERGDYSVSLSKWAPKTDQTWKRGKVRNFDRQDRGAWDLLFLALRACVGSRNPEKRR